MHGDDPLGEKLRTKERAEEDIFFAKRDQELIERLRKTIEEERHVREQALMRCPDCGARLTKVTHYGVTVDECPTGHGMWLTQTEQDTLARRERDSARRERDSWIARYFYPLKPVV
jgi:hypothetical protein